jgi:glycosyltransferase involved in cell wall biosynthesis
MPKISIIIPAFNAEHYLAEAIESAIACNWSEKEVIIFNDGSTDRTGEIAAHYENTNRGIVRVLTNPDGRNRSVSTARNCAAKESTGEFLAFLDADDRFLSSHPEKAIKCLLLNPGTAFSFGRVHLLIEVENYRKFSNKEEWGGGFNEGEVRGAFEQFLIKNFIPIQAVVCHRLQFFQVGGFDTGLRFQQEDHILWTKIAYLYPIYYINELCAEYRIHNKSYSENLPWDKVASAIQIEYLERISRWIPKSDDHTQIMINQNWQRIRNQNLGRLYKAVKQLKLSQAVQEIIALRNIDDIISNLYSPPDSKYNIEEYEKAAKEEA